VGAGKESEVTRKQKVLAREDEEKGMIKGKK
jgi:hypothetical protein